MSTINISHLSFSYGSSTENLFDDVSLTLNTDWKLGLIGRNGKGKTTFLNLLLGKYDYEGKITSHVDFEYFPFKVPDPSKTPYEIAEEIDPNCELWKIEREISLLKMGSEVLNRPFSTLSKGEQTKVLLAILFTKTNTFLLIDEPTNHLDIEARKIVADYLKSKSGFVLVSHDRALLDACVDHILAINRSNIELVQGNFSSWYKNKTRRDNFEIAENKKLKKEIKRLDKAAKQTANWADQVEATIIGGGLAKGHISRMSAKMMKRSIIAKNRIQQDIEKKSGLLKNVETLDELKFNQLPNPSGRIIEATSLSLFYSDRQVTNNLSFFLEDRTRLQVKGKNGSGKSSILKLLARQNLTYSGELYLPSHLKISYVPQDTSNLKGSLDDFIGANNVDGLLFKAILRRLDLERECFTKNLENYSEGQKKKVLLAKSLSEYANIYIWDEPLNYIDVFSRMQIEEAILKYQPTMIFVEHDEEFSQKVATRVLGLWS